MTPADAIELGRHAVWTAILVGAPIMVIAVVVGLAVSVFQALTQLQEQTLSFVPKLLAMFLVFLYLLPWLVDVMVEYSVEVYERIPATLIM